MTASTPTVDDVARAAGVSTATVSRALNQPGSVRPALRQKVLDAVARLGYVAHAGARAMSLRRSGTVGVVVPTIDNAIFASGLQAFQRRMADAGQVVLLAFSDYDPAQEVAQVQALLARGVDALALTGISQRPDLLTLLAQRGLPWVHTGAFPAPPGCACVGFRNRVAVVTGGAVPAGPGPPAHRHAGRHHRPQRPGGRTRGRRAGGPGRGRPEPSCALARRGAVHRAGGARSGPPRVLQGTAPTALICGNDVLAFGALLECAAAGVDVPRSMSVIGFDDLELARQWRPALTTVHVPTEQMWTLAAEYLLGRLDGSVGEPLQRELEVELVVRESSARPPRRAAGR
jgi:LacI family transcriptional regulator